MRRFAVLAVFAAVAVALFVVLRPGEDDEQAATTPTAGVPPTTSRTAPTTTPPAPGPRAPTVIRIAVRGGRVIGGVRRAILDRGDRAVLVVRADVSDHVHLHGYDRFADVAPRRPARLRFRATIAGRFEAELEDAGLPILQLEVRP